MSLIELQDAERQHPPGLVVKLSSNNPFRNRAASPVSKSNFPSPQASAFGLPSNVPERPVSRNPFLDQTTNTPTEPLRQRPVSPTIEAFADASQLVASKPVMNGHALELFENLNLDEKPRSNGIVPRAGPVVPPRLPRSENIRPHPRGRTSPPIHRSPRSHEEEQQQAREGTKPRVPPHGLDIFADPPDIGKSRRPRRNSESSIADRSSKPLDPDDDRRRRDRRLRERDTRHAGEDRRPHTGRPKKPNQKLDLIDQLDVTSIYGTGLFHHDGPFDACNPHRNRKGVRRAPMQAFPKDSANNAIGGSGPVNKNIDIAQFHGRGAEGFTDYSTSGTVHAAAEPYSFEPSAGAGAPVRMGTGVQLGIDRTSSFNPTARVEPVHGDESMGLGTSTFLEGAPASRTAIQRRESEADTANTAVHVGGGGLGRKRSLVQKFKGISSTNRGAGTIGRVMSPDRLDEPAYSPTKLYDGHALSAGGIRRINDANPFFNDFGDSGEKKGANIQVAEHQRQSEEYGNRARALSSPKRAATGGVLERRVTNDGSGGFEGESKSSGGFLSRVKSLKGRRARPDRN